jgi:hypothetical protein
MHVERGKSPIFLRSQGAARDPQPSRRGQAQLRGPKAGRIVRLLTDVRPPYGVREIATATGVASGYVSKVLETLDRQALIEREPRGPVEAVNIPGLLHRYVKSYDVLKNNTAATFLAPAGAADALRRLTDTGARCVVTGSFAAVRLAPVAAPSLLMAYCDDIEKTAAALDLLPTDSGANVALLSPYDPVVWERTITDGGIGYVAPTQVAMDCLSRSHADRGRGRSQLAHPERRNVAGRRTQRRWLHPVSASTGMPVDPRYVAARRVLLDALQALDARRDAIVIAGA